jgi:hypothetical protein
MRYRLILAALAIVFLFSGCRRSEHGWLHFGFTVDYDVPEQTLPGAATPVPLPPQPLSGAIPIDLASNPEFNSKAFNHLVRIKLKQLVFTITPNSTDPAFDSLEPGPPTPDDWSFLESIELWVRYPGTSLEAMIAYVGAGDPQLTPGNTTLWFVCLDYDILEYFDANYSTELILKVVGTTPPDDVLFTSSMKFEFVAALIK